MGRFAPTNNLPWSGNFFLGLVDPSRNRLASTAYFAKSGFRVLHAWLCIHQYKKKIVWVFVACGFCCLGLLLLGLLSLPPVKLRANKYGVVRGIWKGLGVRSLGRVSTGPSKPQKALERLTFESGLRKPYKALVLEMEPYKMKKCFFVKQNFYFVEPQIFFVKRQYFFVKQQHFFVERQKKYFLARAL